MQNRKARVRVAARDSSLLIIAAATALVVMAALVNLLG